MFGSAVLDTAIGLTFIFFVTSTMCSSTFSLIARLRETRSNLLRKALVLLLDKTNSPTLTNEILKHPLVNDIKLDRRNFISSMGMGELKIVTDKSPAYIPSKSFSEALIDLCIRAAKTSAPEEFARDTIEGKIQEFVGSTMGGLSKELREEIHKKLLDAFVEGESIFNGYIQDHPNLNDLQKKIILERSPAIFQCRHQVLNMIGRGLEELALPAQTKLFLTENIDLLKRRHSGPLANSEELLKEFSEVVEEWFNNAMDSLTSIFKKISQLYILWMAIVVTIFFNINAVTITETLWRNPTARAAIVETADTRLNEAQTDTNDDRNPAQIFKEDLATLDIPVGWTAQDLDAIGLNVAPFTWIRLQDSEREAPTKNVLISGWFLTVLATLLGAPFWFDILNKLVNLRTEVKPKEKETNS